LGYNKSIPTDKEVIMAKDSQIDNKNARKKKANDQTPLTRENQNQNRNAKKQSIRNNDV
jgi:uncharacterized protein YhaN